MQVQTVNKNEIIIEYLPKIKYIVKALKHENLPPIVDEEDLIQVGVLGLYDALEKYDPSKGIKLSTYAEIRIRGYIIDHLRQLDWVPRSVRSKIKNLENKIAQLEAQLGRQAKTEEIANYLGMTVEEYMTYAEVLANKVLISLDSDVSKDDDESLHLWEVISSNDDTPDKVVEEKQLKEILSDIILNHLDERERLLISLYYYEELNMKEIADILGITESRVSQLHTKIMLKLKNLVMKYLE
ncbi:sigma-70 family RNA polymerase sigma factor [Sulfurihydrogenibium azorense]|uniref:RNA polymerase sigma factor n=1 Tax=Sulfurihydrogenibium azorense (strain DSM 15241 / OCM 825 / Az-Fu1) TaxID=204536 RepID=C1DXR9_SULAA|nr:FliA/WhiG family RNA polymerase sigma factor [Sulfurihydrogenibium azorense]ACN99296.1 RNA polymerase sigma-D factor (Sigma-28) [Sulfurihydrogenibium azorense Az-Fu1]